MVIEFPPLRAPQTAAELSPSQKTFSPALSPSTINSQAEKSEGGSSILDCITFIPRKIWALIQMLFCCKSQPSQPLAELIESDPAAAVKKAIQMIDEGQKPEVRKVLADAAIALVSKQKEWQRFEAEVKASGNAPLKECLAREIRPLRTCADFSEVMEQHDLIADSIVQTLLAFGYDEGIALIRRCFETSTAAKDLTGPKTSQHLALISQAIRERTLKWNTPGSAAAAAALQGEDERPTDAQLEIHRRLPRDSVTIFSAFLGFDW